MVLQAVIFDLGGTLIYHRTSLPELIQLGYQALTDYLMSKEAHLKLDDVSSVSIRVYNAYEKFAEESFVELEPSVLYSSIMRQLGVDDFSEDFIEGAVESFYGPLLNDYDAYPDSEQTLHNLKERGLKLGLVTNNHSAYFSSNLLHSCDLERFFDVIVCSGQLGIRKPHKGIFLHCLRKLGVSHGDAVFVGDEPAHDIRGARDAGIRSIWVKRNEHDTTSVMPDWTVKSISEAEKVIDVLL
jgi:putative hydrolase of the HAD superfamily